MTRIILVAIAILTMALPAFAQYGSQVHVDSYQRRDGTRVQGHYRSAPDGRTDNNWSSQGNVNPYTGQRGYDTGGGQLPTYLPNGRGPSGYSTRGW